MIASSATRFGDFYNYFGNCSITFGNRCQKCYRGLGQYFKWHHLGHCDLDFLAELSGHTDRASAHYQCDQAFGNN